MFCECLNVNIKNLFHIIIFYLVHSIVVLRRVELSDNPAYSCVRDEHIINNHFTNRVYENVS